MFTSIGPCGDDHDGTLKRHLVVLTDAAPCSARQMVASPYVVPRQCSHRLARSVTLSDPSAFTSSEHRLSIEYSTSGLGSLNPLIVTLPSELALEFMQRPPINVGINSPLGGRGVYRRIVQSLDVRGMHLPPSQDSSDGIRYSESLPIHSTSILLLAWLERCSPSLHLDVVCLVAT